MPDREKVIKGLDVCLKNIDRPDCPNDCPFLSDCLKYENRVVFQPLMRDAIALLKEQQGTIRKKQDDINMLCNEIAKLKHKLHDKWTGTWEWISDDKYRCSECANETYVDECMEEPQYLFCPYCGSKMTFAGRSVKWE